MKPHIVSNFVQNSIIKPGSTLLVSYVNDSSFGLPAKSKDIFRVVRIIRDGEKYFFTLSAYDKEKSLVAKSEQITEVDGMTEDRIISAFNLMDDGSKKPRKRRKRRTKQEILLAQQQMENRDVQVSEISHTEIQAN